MAAFGPARKVVCQICVNVCEYVYMGGGGVCEFVGICMYIHIYMYVYVCMYIHMYMHVYD